VKAIGRARLRPLPLFKFLVCRVVLIRCLKLFDHLESPLSNRSARILGPCAGVFELRPGEAGKARNGTGCRVHPSRQLPSGGALGPEALDQPSRDFVERRRVSAAGRASQGGEGVNREPRVA